MAKFVKTIATIDSHTAGESTRLVVSGLPSIRGETMAAKLAYAAERLPWAPGLLLLEPRGHRDMYGAVLTPPCHSEADAGVIFMDNKVYEPMCGHGLIGVVTCLLETGIVPMTAPTTTVTMDTAAGLVRAEAAIENGRVASVTFENAPAFVYRRNLALDVPGLPSPLVVDIAFGGNFFTLVNAAQIDIPLRPENAASLAVLGMRILEATNAGVTIHHPELPHINRVIDMRFYTEPGYDGADSRNVVVLGDHMIDRSPCGTGTCAELALRSDQGQLGVGQPWTVESIIGTRFTGKVARETHVGPFPAIIPRVTGSAYITGFCQWVLDPSDPFPQGYALGLEAS